MIISDLKHLEIIEESTNITGGFLNVASPQAVFGFITQNSIAIANSGGNNGINFGPAIATSFNIATLTQNVTGYG
jgi:hypothetical protein